MLILKKIEVIDVKVGAPYHLNIKKMMIVSRDLLNYTEVEITMELTPTRSYSMVEVKSVKG